MEKRKRSWTYHRKHRISERLLNTNVCSSARNPKETRRYQFSGRVLTDMWTLLNKKSKLQLKISEIFLSKIPWQFTWCQSQKLKTHYRDTVCHQDIERQQKPWMWHWSNIMIKCSPDFIHQCIADILNQVAETCEYPDDIRLGHLIQLPTPYKP